MNFLQVFIAEGMRWAHLDIADPSYSPAEAYGYTPHGGIGTTVRTFVQLLEHFRLVRQCRDLTACTGPQALADGCRGLTTSPRLTARRAAARPGLWPLRGCAAARRGRR